MTLSNINWKWIPKWFICNIVLMWCISIVHPCWKTETTSTLDANAIYLSKIFSEASANLFQSRCLRYVSHILSNYFIIGCRYRVVLNSVETFQVPILFKWRSSMESMCITILIRGVVCVLVASEMPLISRPFFLIFNAVHGFINYETVRLHVYDFSFLRPAYFIKIKMLWNQRNARLWLQFSPSCIFHKD